MADPIALSVGALILCGGVWLVADRDRTATWIHEQFNANPDPRWKPNWLPWNFRPTMRQARALSWLFALAILSFATLTLAVGSGIHLGS